MAHVEAVDSSGSRVDLGKGRTGRLSGAREFSQGAFEAPFASALQDAEVPTCLHSGNMLLECNFGRPDPNSALAWRTLKRT